METNDERRLRKLKEICAAAGGHRIVAKESKLSAASLDQILKGVLLPPKQGGKPRKPRGLGDPAARAIEGAYKLDRGWFDNDDEVGVTPDELLLLGYYRKLDPDAQRVLVKDLHEVVEQRAQLVAKLRGDSMAMPEPVSKSALRPGHKVVPKARK